MYQAESGLWWYKGMERLTCAVLDRWYARDGKQIILDAGCGTGSAAAGFLTQYGTVTAFDLAAEALRYCKLRQVERLTRASVVAIPFGSEIFDLAVSFDVVSAGDVADDRAALKEFHRILAPGGRVVLRLAALECLRGQHDRAVDNARRYTRREAAEKLTSNGFSVELVSYANTFLLPLALIKRWGERVWPSRRQLSELTINVWPINRLLQAILSSEAPFLARGFLPIGVSVIAVGRKPREV